MLYMASREGPRGWSGSDQSLLGEYYGNNVNLEAGERMKLISGLYNTAPQSCAYVTPRRVFAYGVFFFCSPKKVWDRERAPRFPRAARAFFMHSYVFFSGWE